MELEGRRSPLEPKGWCDEAQLKSWKSVAQAEGRLTKEKPKGREDILGGAEGGKSHSGADCSTGLGGVVGTEVQGGAPGSTMQGGAGKFSDRGKSLVTRTGAEGLRRGNAGRTGGLGSAGGGEQTGLTGSDETDIKFRNVSLG